MGAGMTFVIASAMGIGHYSTMGVGPELGSFIAVEFDTYSPDNPSDPQAQHIGLDINNLNSVATGIPSSSLSSPEGVPFTVWVEYDGVSNRFQVYMARNSSIKPASPTLSTTYNITTALLPNNSSAGYFMGFTAGTYWWTSEHNVLSWCFNAGGLDFLILAEMPCHRAINFLMQLNDS